MANSAIYDTEWPVEVPAFGAEMRENEFMLDPEYTFLNHGSYGCMARRVFEKTNLHRLEFERNPDKGMRLEQTPKWERALPSVAQFLDVDAGTIALVENTTTGIANILQSFPLAGDDVILTTVFTYSSMRHQVEELITHRKPAVKKQVLQLPMMVDSQQQIIDLYRQALEANSNIKLAIVDHIISVPARVNPVKEIVELCHKHDVAVLIDGAHAPGQLQLSIRDIAPDFYVGTFHKWVYSARGCAFQYVHPKYHSIISPARLSNYYHDPYPGDFIIQGLRDDSPYHSLECALQFYKWVGGWESISVYCGSLLDRALPLLSAAWGTPLIRFPEDIEAPFLKMIRMPHLPAYGLDNSRLGFDLYQRFKIWTMIVKGGDHLYIRLSANIYCVMSDYEKLRDSVVQLMKEAPDCEAQTQARAVYDSTYYKH